MIDEKKLIVWLENIRERNKDFGIGYLRNDYAEGYHDLAVDALDFIKEHSVQDKSNIWICRSCRRDTLCNYGGLCQNCYEQEGRP